MSEPGSGGGEAPSSPEGSAGEEPLDRLRLGVLLVLGAGAAVVLWVLLEPFVPALMTSAVFATLCYPAHRRLRRWVRQPDVAAFLTTAAVFFLVLVPIVGFSVVLAAQLQDGIEWLAGVVERLTRPGGLAATAWEQLAERLGLETSRLGETVRGQASDVLGLMARRTLAFLTGLGGWLLQGGAALFALFYFLRDGDGLVRAIKWMVPLDGPATDRLVGRIHDVIHATVFGQVVVAIVQGTLGGLTFWLLGLPAAALWGTVMGLLSLLPVVGPPLVWLPAAAILLAEGSVARGIVLLAVGGGLIGTVDNWLRAVLVGNRAQLHSLVVFFSVLGGLFAFGAIGIFVGPVLFVIALSLVEIARTAMEAGSGAASGQVVPPDGGIFTAVSRPGRSSDAG